MTTASHRLGRTLASTLAVAAISGGGSAFAAPAAMQMTFDVTTYTVPAGFELLEGGTTHANFRRVDSGNWLLFGVYGSRPSSGNLTADFAADWKDVSGAPDVAAPSPANRKVGAGIAAVEGGALCPAIGFVDLIDIGAGGKVVTIIIESGSAEGFTKTYRKTIDAFLSTLLVKPTPGATPPPNSAPAGKPSSLSAGDAVGHWYVSDQSTVSYVDSNTGNYAGSSATFYGVGYDLAANGTYTRHFRGMANGHIVDEKGSGKWELTPDRFVLNNGNNTTRYQLLGFQKSADGAMQIDLLDEQYPPQSGNIALYSEHWKRAAPK